MTNSVDMANDLINRARNLKEFEVEREIGDNGIFFDGEVPFNVRANKERAWFKVHATTLEEAERMIEFYRSCRVCAMLIN